MMSGKSISSNFYHNLYINFISNEVHVPDTKYYSYKLTRWMYLLAVHPLFSTFIMIIIALNTIILALDRYPDDETTNKVSYICNIAFTIIFSFEVIIKMIAFSLKGFIRDKFNIFDTIVVLISIIELTVIRDGDGSSLSSLRAFRLFRVFKIFRVGDLKVLMDSIGITILGMGNYSILLILFMYLFALLGMQFFAGKFKFGYDGLYSSSGDPPRENFDTLWEAFITITIIMIGDGWNSIMYYGMLSEGTIYCLYFVILYTLGNVIMLNLFLAILLGNFDAARQLMAKKRAFEEFKKHKKKTPLPIALVIVLGDLGEYIRDNVIKDDVDYIKEPESDKMKENNILRSSRIHPNAPNSENNTKGKFDATDMNEESKENNLMHEEMTTMRKTAKFGGSPGYEAQIFERSRSIDRKERIKHMYPLADIHQKFTARTKIDSTVEAVLNELPELCSPVNEINSLMFLKAGPANQQEGAAYDNDINNFSDQYMSQDSRVKSSERSYPFDNNKISEIEDISEDSKEFSKSQKRLRFDEEPQNHYISGREKVPVEFEGSSDDETEYKRPFWKRILNYLKRSSLFIFHDSWKFRQLLIHIVISTESLTTRQPKDVQERNEEEKQKSHKDSDSSSNKSFDESLNTIPKYENVYHVNDMKIVNGKIVTTKGKLTISKWFENIIIVLILANSLALVLDNPLADPNGAMSKVFSYMDILFTIAFAIEAIMKIVALGFFWNAMPGIQAYIVNGWNILDFIIVVSS